MSNKKKTEAVRIIAVALSTKEDAARTVREAVKLQLDMEARIVERDRAVEAVTKGHNAGIDEIGAKIAGLMAQLEQWATTHPEVFPAPARSIKLDGHAIGWRYGNHAAKALKGWTWNKVVAALELTRKRIREKYLRTKVEANKEAMIADRRRAKLLAKFGVEIVQGETFYLEPNRDGQADPVLTGERKAVAA